MKKCLHCQADFYGKKFCNRKCSAQFKAKNAVKISEEKIRELYLDKKLPLTEVATILNCSISNIYSLIKKYNIPNRGTFTDYSGTTIGNLKILEAVFPEKRSGGGKHVSWKCECLLCGNIHYVLSHVFMTLKNKSCKKCAIKTKRISKYIWGTYFQSIKTSAKHRNLEFNLTIDYLTELVDKQNKKCALSGVELIFASSAKEHIAGFWTASLDRIDSSKGYIIDNVQWVHKEVNTMKLNHEQCKFIKWCEVITEYQKFLKN